MRIKSASRYVVPVALTLISLCTGASFAEPDKASTSNPEQTVQTKQSNLPVAASATESSVDSTSEDAAPVQSAVESDSEDSAATAVEAAPAAPAARTTEQITNAALKHWELSQKYYSSWDWKMCELELELAIMELPTMQIAHRDLCVLSFLQLNWPKSIAEFMMTVGLGDPIPLTPEESAKLVRTAMVKHYNKAMEFARKQNWKNTIEELLIAAELAPEDSVIQRSLAFAYASSGDFKTAEQCYEKTFNLAPSDGSSHADFAYFLADQGKLNEAQKQLEEAVKSSPDSAAFHVDLCWMAESRGDLATAVKELQAAVDLSPKHAGLWSHLGRILEQKGEKEKATQAYLKALWLDPHLEDAKEHLAKLQSAES